MRWRRSEHPEDQIREKMIPAADAGPVAATNGSVNGDGSLNGHQFVAEFERSGFWDRPTEALPCLVAAQPPPVHTVAPPPLEHPAATLFRTPEGPDTLDAVDNEAVAAPPPVVASVSTPEFQLEEPRGAHVMKGEAATDESCGAHVMKGDPLLSVERRALHAIRAEPLATPVLSTSTPEAALMVCDAPNPAVRAGARKPEHKAAHALSRKARPARRRGFPRHGERSVGLRPCRWCRGRLGSGPWRWRRIRLLHEPGRGLGLGLHNGGGPVTIAVTATTGKADLLPGAAGAAYFTLHNANSSSVTFHQVAPGATVVSDNTSLCASSYVSIAPTLPYTIPTAVTVSPGGTSGIQSIASLVKLAANAPGTCQGVTFTMTLTLSGQSS